VFHIILNNCLQNRGGGWYRDYNGHIKAGKANPQVRGAGSGSRSASAFSQRLRLRVHVRSPCSCSSKHRSRLPHTPRPPQSQHSSSRFRTAQNLAADLECFFVLFGWSVRMVRMSESLISTKKRARDEEARKGVKARRTEGSVHKLGVGQCFHPLPLPLRAHYDLGMLSTRVTVQQRGIVQNSFSGL
jgi:hypothetical protein